MTVGAGGVVMWLEVLSCDCRCWRCCHVTVGGGMWLEVLSCDCHVTVCAGGVVM